MSDGIDRQRRHLLGALAMSFAAARLGMVDVAKAQPSSSPSFSGASAWLNSPPLTLDALRGKVVLVSFCTYTCINWLRSLPYVRAWADKYKDQGLIVVGVHTPEFSFEKNFDNVRQAVKDMRINYPIAIDNDYAIWRAFDNAYWPAFYFTDARGRIRYQKFGEGDYDQAEVILQRLLADAGTINFDQQLVSVKAQGIEAPADWDNLKSPENYVSYGRTENFASPGGPVPNMPRVYVAAASLPLNHWALAGNWTMAQQATVLNQANGSIIYRFRARDLHLVMGGPDAGKTAVPFRIRIDGKLPGASHGLDTDSQGNGSVNMPRLYQLVRQAPPVVERQFEIEFLGSDVQAYAFTFG